jgi:lysophospholipase L1-like esterase
MKRIACFGDSNVYGYDPRSWMGGRYPSDVRWTGLLEAAGWQVRNEGFNGQEIPTSQWEQDHWCERLRMTGDPDWVLVMLGGNDLLCHAGFTAGDVAKRMEAMLRRFQAVADPARTRLLLVSPPPMVPGTWITEDRLLVESARMAGCYRSVAEDLGISFADAGTWGIDLAFDGVHFLPAGHRTFAQRLLSVLDGT